MAESGKTSARIKYVLFLYFGFICLICMHAYVCVHAKTVQNKYQERFGVSYIKIDIILMVLVQYVRNLNPYVTRTFLFLKQNCLRNCSKITSNRKLFNIHTMVKYQNRGSWQAAGNTSVFSGAVRCSGISFNKKIKTPLCDDAAESGFQGSRKSR